jgi:hypothetical protein
METLGSLHDKLSIVNIRLNVLKQQLLSTGWSDRRRNELSELYPLVDSQRSDLELEIRQLIEAAERVDSNMKLEEPKYKIYQGESASGVGFNTKEEAILHLKEANQILWNLEDQRRDKSKSDSEIRQICDDVAKYNRIRNDTMDQINMLFHHAVSSRKMQQ